MKAAAGIISCSVQRGSPRRSALCGLGDLSLIPHNRITIQKRWRFASSYTPDSLVQAGDASSLRFGDSEVTLQIYGAHSPSVTPESFL